MMKEQIFFKPCSFEMLTNALDVLNASAARAVNLGEELKQESEMKK